MNFESASERHTPMSSNETSHFGKPAGRDLPPGTSLNPFASLAASSWANMHLEHLGSLLLTHVAAGPGILLSQAAPRVCSPPHPRGDSKNLPCGRNLLPLPLPSDTAEEYYTAEEEPASFKAVDHLRQEYIRRPGLRAWLILINGFKPKCSSCRAAYSAHEDPASSVLASVRIRIVLLQSIGCCGT